MLCIIYYYYIYCFFYCLELQSLSEYRRGDMNIKTLNKKAGAVILLGSMIISLCGCSMFSKKDVVAAAKEVAENIVDFDADKLLDLSTLNKKGEKAEDLRKGLNGDYLDENSKKFCNAVKKTMSYEIDEKSFSIQGNEATIDIIFEMADYELILKKDYKDIDELVSAVRNSDDTDKVTFNAVFVKEDGQWLLDNLMSKGFTNIFEFMDADLGVLAVDLANIVNKNSTKFSGESDGNVTNAKKLSLNVAFQSDVTKLKGKGVKLIYEVSKDNKTVWTSQPFEIGNNTRIYLDYGTNQNPDAEMKSNYIAEGTYKFTLKAENGTVVYTASVNVKVSVRETTSSGTGNTSSQGYKFYDSVFASKVITAAWMNVDNKRVNATSYGSDATRISFQMQVQPDAENVYFAFFYASSVAEALKINVRSDTPAISGEGKPIVNSNGTFYALGLKSKSGTNMKPGIYILAIYSADRQTLYGLAECQILTKPTSSYKG